MRLGTAWGRGRRRGGQGPSRSALPAPCRRSVRLPGLPPGLLQLAATMRRGSRAGGVGPGLGRAPRLLHRCLRAEGAPGCGWRSEKPAQGTHREQTEERQCAGLSEAGHGHLHRRCQGSGPPYSRVSSPGLLGKFSQAARDGGPQPQATQNGGRAGLRGTFQGLRGRGLGPGLLRQPRNLVISPQQQSENSCLLTPRGRAAHLCGWWRGGGLRAGAGQGPRLHSLP